MVMDYVLLAPPPMKPGLLRDLASVVLMLSQDILVMGMHLTLTELTESARLTLLAT